MIPAHKPIWKRTSKTTDPWAVLDKIAEIRGKLTLKQRDQETYYVVTSQRIKENETEIRNLRGEIHEKRILRKLWLNADERVIKEGFADHRESQLAMQRYTIAEAMCEKTEHVFDKVKELNAARYERNRRVRRKRELSLKKKDMERAAKSSFNEENNQRVRVLLTSIDKMKQKYTSACFIQKTYVQILYHLERDNLNLPGRLRLLEVALQNNRLELEGDLYQIHQDARKAFGDTKRDKERIEANILKEKRERDRDLADVRRVFRKLNQREDYKEYRPKKRVVEKQIEAETKKREKSSVDFWEGVRRFWRIKRAIDNLKDEMSVGMPADIAPCFKAQIRRREELFTKVDSFTARKQDLTKKLESFMNDLDVVSRSCHVYVEESDEMRRKITNDIDALCSEAETKRLRAKDIENLVHAVSGGVAEIRQKTLVCDWITKEILVRRNSTQPKSPLSVAVSTRRDDVCKSLRRCEAKLCKLDELVRTRLQNQQDFVLDLSSAHGQEMIAIAIGTTPYNTRVCIADEDEFVFTEDFFGDDDDTNDQYLSRDAVKSTMRQFTEENNRRRRRRPKK